MGAYERTQLHSPPLAGNGIRRGTGPPGPGRLELAPVRRNQPAPSIVCRPGFATDHDDVHLVRPQNLLLVAFTMLSPFISIAEYVSTLHIGITLTQGLPQSSWSTTLGPKGTEGVRGSHPSSCNARSCSRRAGKGRRNAPRCTQETRS